MGISGLSGERSDEVNSRISLYDTLCCSFHDVSSSSIPTQYVYVQIEVVHRSRNTQLKQ